MAFGAARVGLECKGAVSDNVLVGMGDPLSRHPAHTHTPEQVTLIFGMC